MLSYLGQLDYQAWDQQTKQRNLEAHILITPLEQEYIINCMILEHKIRSETINFINNIRKNYFLTNINILLCQNVV